MRMRNVGLATLFCVALAASAQAADRHMFIIANDSDGYGVDRCLATGDKCGAAAANAYCKSQEYAQASSYRKVDREEITGAIPSGGGCPGGNCNNIVAIVCTR